jgi:hypothetical protein
MILVMMFCLNVKKRMRRSERSIDIPADVATYRANVIAWATATEASITAVTTVEQLKEINLGVSI